MFHSNSHWLIDYISVRRPKTNIISIRYKQMAAGTGSVFKQQIMGNKSCCWDKIHVPFY